LFLLASARRVVFQHVNGTCFGAHQFVQQDVDGALGRVLRTEQIHLVSNGIDDSALPAVFVSFATNRVRDDARVAIFIPLRLLDAYSSDNLVLGVEGRGLGHGSGNEICCTNQSTW